MEYIALYLLFLAKAITVVFTILFIMIGMIALAQKDKEGSNHLTVKKLNDKFSEMAKKLSEGIKGKESYRQYLKEQKKNLNQTPVDQKTKRRLFVLDFEGDIRASAVSSLREEITALLTIAKKTDEVVVRLESPGGAVNAYGLAASQLLRIKQHGIHLTVTIDKIATSGGYLMACVADRILAAPFAIIGSVGVVAQLPNFNRWLKKNSIDFELLTAGEYKRTLTVFGENTSKGREKVKQDLEEIHQTFKTFVKHNRPQTDIEKVATGEYWLASKAIELLLVDELTTSDDYLLNNSNSSEIFSVRYKKKKSFPEKLANTASLFLKHFSIRETEKNCEQDLWM